MRIVSPERDKSFEIPDSRLPEFLSDHGLVTVRSGIADTHVAFPAASLDLVIKAFEGDIPRVNYKNPEQLSHDVEVALADAEFVALIAGKHLMRDFFNTEKFCQIIKEVTSKLEAVELAVPPGAYTDHKHLAVWRHKSK